jgi:hypothetical protein
MKHDKTPVRSPNEKLAHVVRVAEQVLAQAYRGLSRQELIESQLRVRESVVREMRRRLK